MAPPTLRRTHRKRGSVLRLSTDTTATLPEYISNVNAGSWHHRGNDDPPSDRPPDYPDSAEEADEDTEPESGPCVPHQPPLLTPAISYTPPSPKRTRKPASGHRRKRSQVSLHAPPRSNDVYLDSLLARSVHALEMSNTLLQCSMETQKSPSSVFAVDSPIDTPVTRVCGLSTVHPHSTASPRPAWADELDELSRGVETLFSDGCERVGMRMGTPRAGPSSSISMSLPVTSPISSRMPSVRRRPSLLDLRGEVDPAGPSSSTHLPLEEPHVGLHGLPSSPCLTNRPLEPSTPAYNMLSSFVTKSSQAASSNSLLSTPLFHRTFLPRRHSLNSSPQSQRPSVYLLQGSKSPERKRRDGTASVSSITPKQIISTLPQGTMTPPSEELSSASDGCPAKLTVLNLRKILDEHPKAPSPEHNLRAPSFHPRTPPSISEASTSTTTASVSRLFTKSKHTSSTRAPSPPRQSAMKHPSPALSPSSSTQTIPDLLSVRNWGDGGLSSRSGSGRSTPKRISFAQLPESYSGTKSGGSSSRFRDMQKKRKNRRRSRSVIGNGKEFDGSGESESDIGWWPGWLWDAGPMLRIEDRMEDRPTRNWGARMAGAGYNDWPV